MASALNDFDRSSFTLLQGLLTEHVLAGDKLSYHAIANACERRFNYTAAIREGRELDKALDNFMKQELDAVHVKASDRKSATFHYVDRGGGIDDFGEGGEYEYRHPGTTWGEGDVDDWCPITTKAGQHLLALSFSGAAVGGPAPHAVLRSTYPLQLTIRVDDLRQALNFDCFEFSPPSMDLDEPTDLPSVRSIHRFEKCSGMRSLVGYAKTKKDAQAVVQPNRGSFTTSDRAVLLLQATAGDLMAARMLRFRLNISSITGARLVKPRKNPALLVRGPERIQVSLAALILEVSAPPTADAFAARLVHSENKRENRFMGVPDWTPDQVASKASRIYVYGGLQELHELAAHLATISPHFAALIGSFPEYSNSLSQTSLARDAAPPFVQLAETQPSHSCKRQKTCLSEEEVHALLVARGLADAEEVQDVNACLKKGVQLGLLDLHNKCKDDAIYKGTCVHCSEALVCTVGDALWQHTHGGDYEDGGQCGAVKCRVCKCRNYITALCTANPSFDSGKGHNHCIECEDFGECLRDYRMEHCELCGAHYFAGLSGMPCQECEGRGQASGSLADMPPPHASVWSGLPLGAEDRLALKWPSYSKLEQHCMRACGVAPAGSDAATAQGAGPSGQGVRGQGDALKQMLQQMLLEELAALGPGGSSRAAAAAPGPSSRAAASNGAAAAPPRDREQSQVSQPRRCTLM